MSQEPTAAAVRPDPATTRTIGLLNALFGALLVVFLPCAGVYLAAVANVSRLLDLQNSQVETVVKNSQKRRLELLAAREKAAQTPEEKARIEIERADVKSGPPVALATIDLKPMTSALSDPRIVRYFIVDLGTGFLVNLLLLGSGLGLCFLKEWARRLALGVAALKIARIVVLYVYYMAVVGPIWASVQERAYLEVLRQDPAITAATVHAKPEDEAARFARTSRTSNLVIGSGMLVLGPAYPVVVLYLLNRPGVRAACRRPKDAR
jgi:hypothetical protein